MRPSVLISIGAVVLGGLASSASASAPGPASILSRSDAAFDPVVAFDRDGVGHVAWPDGSAVATATAPAGGTAFGPTRTLVSLTDRDDFPAVAFDPDGRAVVAVRRAPYPNARVRVIFERGDGTTTAPLTISPRGRDTGLPVLRTDAQGNAVAAWTVRRRDGRWGVQYALRPAGGAFAPARDIPGPDSTDSFQPEVAVSPGGRLIVAFEGSVQLRAAVGTMTDGVGRTQAIGRFRPNYAPMSAAIGDDGRTVLVWVDNHYVGTAPGPTTVNVVRAGTNGVFGRAQTVDRGAIGDDSPTTAITGDGTTLIAWPRHAELRTVTGAPDAPLGRPSRVATVGDYAVAPALAAGPHGDALLAWTHDRDTPKHDGVYSVVQLSRRPAGGVFGPPVVLSSATEEALDPVPTLAADGRALTAWVQSPSGGGNGNLQATVVTP